jgi:uncharacterized protein YneF (UPF0154 family)
MEALILFGLLALIGWGLVVGSFISKKRKEHHTSH